MSSGLKMLSWKKSIILSKFSLLVVCHSDQVNFTPTFTPDVETQILPNNISRSLIIGVYIDGKKKRSCHSSPACVVM